MIFFFCFPGLPAGAISCYILFAVAKSTAGRRNPSYSMATPDAPRVFLCPSLSAPIFRAAVLYPLYRPRNGGPGGAAFGLAGIH